MLLAHEFDYGSRTVEDSSYSDIPQNGGRKLLSDEATVAWLGL